VNSVTAATTVMALHYVAARW